MANVDLGVLTVRLAADVADIKKGMADAQKEVKSTADIMKAEFAKAGGYIGSVGERIGNVGKNIKKVFGDDAPAILQKFGADVQHAMGMSDAQVKGLGQSMEALEGGFKVAGLMISSLTPTVAAVAAAIAGVGVAAVALQDGLTNGFTAAHVALAAFMAPLVIMSTPIIAVVLAVKLMRQAWAEVGDTVAAVWTGIKAFAIGVATAIGDSITWVIKTVTNGIAAALDVAADALKWVEDNDPTGLAAAGGGSGGARRAAGAMRGAAANVDLGALSSAAWDGTKKLVADASASIGSGVDSIMSTFKKDLGVASDFLANLLTPGKKAGKSKALEGEKGESRLARNIKDMDERAAKNTEEAMKAEEQKRKDIIEYNEMFVSTAAFNAEESAKAEKKKADWIGKINDEVIANAEAAAQKSKDKWQALGSGQFGTAAGVGGIGGAALNLVGGAAVGQSQYLGGALQGSAAGAEAGGNAGPWGAVIGALIGLASQSREFKAIMKEIDQVLEAVVNALGKVIGAFQDLFDSLSGLSGLFDLIGGLFKVLSQFDLGMQAVTLIFKAIGQIDFSGATKWFDEAGGWIEKNVGGWFDAVVNGIDETKSMQQQEAERAAAKEAKEFQHDVDKASATGITEFDDSIRKARIDTVLLGDAQYQAKAKAEYFATTLVSMAQAGIDYRNQLELLKTAQGGDQYIQNAIDAAKLEEQKAKLDEIVADRLEALGLGAEKAIDALAKFSDSLINEATGYRLGATRYGSTSEGGPGGAGEAQIDTHMGGGLGIGGAPGTTIVVTLDGAEIAHRIERRRERAQMAGVSTFARAPMLVGG